MAKPVVWAMVPARGGSKSIPKKNLALLGGRPMLDYGVIAGQLSGSLDRIVCSTDDAEIAAQAKALGIEVDIRPEHLATDEAAVADVARDFVQRQGSPDILVLIQPTSPFLLPVHVTSLVESMLAREDVNSGQTVCPTPHNFHAWNQRLVEDNIVRFMFADERRSAYNKQKKPKLYSFGNLVAVKPRALMAGMDFFAEPSIGVTIDWPYNLDVDSLNDLRLAEAMLGGGLVTLSHLN